MIKSNAAMEKTLFASVVRPPIEKGSVSVFLTRNTQQTSKKLRTLIVSTYLLLFDLFGHIGSNQKLSQDGLVSAGYEVASARERAWT